MFKNQINISRAVPAIYYFFSRLVCCYSISISYITMCSVFFLIQFVAQPNCQQLLATLWYDGFPGWRRRHWVVKLITCFTIGLLFPVFSIVYLLAPKSTLGLFIKKPFIKFICHTASYLTFLFLLLLASQHIVQTDLHVQGPPPTIVEWMILPWVLGKDAC